MDDDEPRLQIKLTLKDTPQTKSNGKKSITSILANFQCGIPSPIAQNDTEFSLFKSRKNKNQLLLVEDAQNKVLYYDKRIPSHLSSKSNQIKKIGIFDPQSNEVNLIPVTYSFNMKSETISGYFTRNIISDDENNDTIAKHQDLVATFGSKFAVKNMNKQQRLRKTKDATLAAMDRMDTAQLINDKKEDEKSDDNNSDIYQTQNPNKKRKRSQMENIISETEIDYNCEQHKQKYTNIFQHKFSKSPYCLFEFPYHENANKISKVYILKEIIPNHIWETLDCHRIWNIWDSKNNILFPGKFVQRCMSFVNDVKAKKGENKLNSWKEKLVLYDLTVRFLRNINGRPSCVDKVFWQNLKVGYLEQYVSRMKNGGNNNKKIKYSMTRRGKMRIVGIILLLGMNVAFWKISIEACQDIADDLQIPFRVIIQVYRLLGCVQDDKVVMMKKRIIHRNPTTTIDGEWWNV